MSNSEKRSAGSFTTMSSPNIPAGYKRGSRRDTSGRVRPRWAFWAWVPEKYGGLPGSDYRHSAVVTEEIQALGLAIGGLRVQTDICVPYLLHHATADQRAKWLPRLTSGQVVAALGLSEPGAGSDLKAMSTRARRCADHYVVNGAKTFISNGAEADLVILAVKTDPDAGRGGISVPLVDTSTPGFARGRKLDKLGLHAQNLAEISFTGMELSVENRLGEENEGFTYLTSNLAQERLSIAVELAGGRGSGGLVDRGEVARDLAWTGCGIHTGAVHRRRGGRPGPHRPGNAAACFAPAERKRRRDRQALLYRVATGAWSTVV